MQVYYAGCYNTPVIKIVDARLISTFHELDREKERERMSERGGAGATEITILPSNEPQNNIVRRRTEKIITVMWRREIGNAAIKKEILFA